MASRASGGLTSPLCSGADKKSVAEVGRQDEPQLSLQPKMQTRVPSDPHSDATFTPRWINAGGKDIGVRYFSKEQHGWTDQGLHSRTVFPWSDWSSERHNLSPLALIGGAVELISHNPPRLPTRNVDIIWTRPALSFVTVLLQDLRMLV